MDIKTRRLSAGLAAALAFGAVVPLSWGQDQKPGLDAMGADTTPASAPAPTPAKEEPKPAPEAPPATEATPAPEAAPVTEGQAIVQRACDRIKRAHYASFDVHMFGVGSLAGYTTEARGHVVARRANASAANPWTMRVTGSTVVKAGEPMNFDMALLPNSREWVNHEEKMVHETIKLSPGGKSLTVANSLWPTEIFDRVPYSRVMRSATYTQEAGQEIAGVECDVVLVESKPLRGAASKGRWFIGHEDSFPRRFERLMTLEGAESQIVMEFTNIRVEDQMPADATDATFRVAVPDGYSEKREAPKAPPAPAPAPTPNPTPDAPAGTMPNDTPASGAMGTPSTSSAQPVEPTRPALPAMAPEFELAKIDGTKVSLASMRGTVVVVDFFGTWAMNAEAWHPRLKSLIATHGDRVRLVPVAIRQRQHELAAEMLTRAEITAPVLIGNEALARSYGVTLYPAAAVVGADGTLVEVVQGCGSPSSEDSLRAAIDRALAGVAPAAPAPPTAPATSGAKEPKTVPAPAAPAPGEATSADLKPADPKPADAVPATLTP